MKKSTKIKKGLGASLMIAGTTIGAGMLGIPLTTAKAGFGPGAIATLSVWLLMTITGLLFLQATLWLPDGSNILSITNKILGKRVQIISGSMFLFLYNCLMIAYFSAGSSLFAQGLKNLLGSNISTESSTLCFVATIGVVVAIGMNLIDKVNMALSAAMIISWIILVSSGWSQVETHRVVTANWKLIPWTMPILFSAFGYHNVIPSLATYLHRDKKLLQTSIIIGTTIPLIVYLAWQYIVIGAVPQAIILKQSTADQIISYLPSLNVIGSFFAIFAIITSLLGVSFSMVDFIGDGLSIKNRTGKNRVLLSILAIGPAYLFVMYNPALFAKALSIAGGIGEAFLNVMLPATLAWKGQKMFRKQSVKISSKKILIPTAIAGILVFALELVELF